MRVKVLVMRGGGWGALYNASRSFRRSKGAPIYGSDSRTFRLVVNALT